jgi:hypothetical protein
MEACILVSPSSGTSGCYRVHVVDTLPGSQIIAAKIGSPRNKIWDRTGNKTQMCHNGYFTPEKLKWHSYIESSLITPLTQTL